MVLSRYELFELLASQRRRNISISLLVGTLVNRCLGVNRPPSAELREDQTDQDSLPEYSKLDSILNAYIENDNSINEIISQGHDKNTVEDVIKLVDKNEYKRRQSAPGIKVTSKNFGRDRRMPIANNYAKFIFDNISKRSKK